MNDNILTHYGVLGMRWGRRKGSSASSGGSGSKRKLSFDKDADGRKVDRLLGKRNRTKLKKRLLYNKDWKKDIANDPFNKAMASKVDKLLKNKVFKTYVYNHENFKIIAGMGRDQIRAMFKGGD